MVDRDARTALASLIRQYLNEAVTSFAFDEALDAYRTSSDSTVRYVLNSLWCLYDDVVDHKVVLSKSQWDFIQRLLVVLESDSSVRFTRSYRWGISQVCAAILFLCCALLAVRTGIGYHLVLYFMSFGLASIALSWLRRQGVVPDPMTAALFPFSSLRELHQVYVSTTFRKSPFPAHLANRRIRSQRFESLMQINGYIVWLLVAPIPLLFQSFPIVDSQERVVPA